MRAFVLLLTLTSVASVAAPAEAVIESDDSWTRQFVAQAGRADDYALTRTFIDIGPSGRTMILYSKGPNENGGFDLRLASRPGLDGSFRRERVDPADKLVTGYPSLAVGRRGRPHVSYVSGVFQTEGILKYAVRGASGWTTEVVDPVMPVGQTAIAIGAHRRPVIAYTRVNTELRLASSTNSGWVTTAVSAERVVALDVAVDPDGLPRIAYVAWDGTNYVARLARFDGTSWAFDTVSHVSSDGIEFGIDLLIDADGDEDLVFAVLEPVRGIVAAHSTLAGWATEVVSAGDLWQPAAAYDATGGLHVVLYDATTGALRYARRDDGDWVIRTVADSESPNVRIGRLSSVVIDAQGSAQVSYYVGKATSGTTLRYAVSTPT